GGRKKRKKNRKVPIFCLNVCALFILFVCKKVRKRGVNNRIASFFCTNCLAYVSLNSFFISLSLFLFLISFSLFVQNRNNHQNKFSFSSSRLPHLISVQFFSF